ncbi:hypothetical protein Tco_1274014, partial [Tanacetum coccineum]
TTPTPSITLLTTEVQATTLTATDPSSTVFLRLSELERKVEALSKVDHSEVIEESVQANVRDEVRNKISKFLSKAVYDFINPRIESTFRELKKILFDKMDKSRSYITHDKHQVLYDALLNSVYLVEAIASGEANLDKVLRKRHCDEDQDSIAGSGKKKKRKRKVKDYEPSKDTTQTGSSKGKTPPKTSKTDKSVTVKELVKEPIHEVAMDVEEPILDDVVNDVEQPQHDINPKNDKSTWFKQSPRPKTPDPEWNKDKNVDDGLEQTRFNDPVNAEKDSHTFDELMASPFDFTKFSMNHLKLDKITKADLVGPVYKLLKGTYKSSIELAYNMDQCYNALTDQLDWTNPKGDRCPYDLSKPLLLQGSPCHLTIHVDLFFNNDLEYLNYRVQSRWFMIGMLNYESHTGRPKRQLFYISQINKISKHDVYSMLKILSVVRNKLFNLLGDDIVDLVNALRMFTQSLVIKKRVKDVQLGVESYQKKLNITKPQKEFPGI